MARLRYLVYPDAQEKIISSGLEKRVDVIEKSEDGLPWIGMAMEHDVALAIKEMQKEGYFETFPSEYKKQFMQGLEAAFKNREKFPWKIYREGKILESSLEVEDFYLLTGWMASVVLEPEEIWNYKKFGFSSIEDFVGSFGAFIWQASKGKSFRGGYEWTSKTPSGRMFKNKITGSIHLDLRIDQIDITPDKTIDPLETAVSYRPGIQDDVWSASPYHSTEQQLMVALLKYVHQQNIPSEMLKNKGKPLIDYTESLGHFVGPAAECLMGVDGLDGPGFQLLNFNDPIPVLDNNFSTTKKTFDGLSIDSETYYGIYIGPNKEFILSYHGKERKSKKDISVCFQPEEVDHLLKGICYQCAKGLGRTIPQKMINLLEYRFSGQMEKDLKRWEE